MIIKQKVLYYLDPLRIPCLTTNVLVQKAKTLIDILLKNKIGITTESIESMPRSLQEDGTSCGALICFYAKQISNGDHLCASGTTLLNIRKEIGLYTTITGNCLSWLNNEKSNCLLCNNHTLNDWVECTRCGQWMHCSCANIAIHDAKTNRHIVCPKPKQWLTSVARKLWAQKWVNRKWSWDKL